jgi:endonuclease/exonuclease/phosphatase family metal-dependent hydrolase
VSKLEKGKRKGAGVVFGEKILREVRRGNRMMLLADIESSQTPGGVLTVVATHLEGLCTKSLLRSASSLLCELCVSLWPLR